MHYIIVFILRCGFSGMKKGLFSLILLFVIFSNLNAQRRYGLINRRIESIGLLVISGGPNYCFGDSKVYPFSQNFVTNSHNYDLSIGFRSRFASNFGYKIAYNYGNYEGTDLNTPLAYRGYSYISKVQELTAQGEYSIYFGPQFIKQKHNLIYVFGGVGVMNTVVDFTGEKPGGFIYFPYDYSPVFPFGFGYEYELTSKLKLGAEITWHYSLSDYVDGMHHPLFSRSNDILGGFKVTLSYQIF